MYLAQLFRAYAVWRKLRIAKHQLMQLDDRMLHDIGLNRTSIDSAVRHGLAR